MRVGVGIAFIMMWLLGNFFSGILEETYIGSTEGSALFGMMQTSYWDDGLGTIWKVIPDAFDLFIKALLWDYSFFYGEYIIFRYIGFAVSAGFLISISIGIIQGLATAVSGLLGRR